MLKRFIAYYKNHKKAFVLDMSASMAASILSVVYPIITRKMLNEYIPNKEVNSINYEGLLVLGIYLIRMGLNYYIGYKGHMMGVSIQVEMRHDLFNHLEELPFSFYDNHETGRIMSRLTTDLFDVSELAHHGPENLIVTTTTLIVSIIYLSTISVPLTLVVFIFVPILLGVSVAFRDRHRKAFIQTKAATAPVNANIDNAICGIRVDSLL